jgi:tetratricopeptide (TPR) repeat protein
MARLLLMFFLLVSAPGKGYKAETNELLFNDGAASLLKGDYTHAIILFERLNAKGVKTPALYNNLGNAYYKTGHPGKAILCYEKGLLLSPFDGRLIHNKNLINAKLHVTGANRLLFFNENEPLFVKTIYNTQLAGVILLFISGLLFVLAAFKISAKHNNGIKKGYKIFLLLSVPVLLLSSALLVYINYGEKGIVIKTITARSGPAESARPADRFKEGEKVLILNYFDGWYKIKKDNGEHGWIRTADFGLIN